MVIQKQRKREGSQAYTQNRNQQKNKIDKIRRFLRGIKIQNIRIRIEKNLFFFCLNFANRFELLNFRTRVESDSFNRYLGVKS